MSRETLFLVLISEILGFSCGIPQFSLQRLNDVWLEGFEYEIEFHLDWPADGEIDNTTIGYLVIEKNKTGLIAEGRVDLRGRPYESNLKNRDDYLAETINITEIEMNNPGERHLQVIFSYDEDNLFSYVEDPSSVQNDIEMVEFSVHVIPKWVSILPVAVTILYAIFTQEVLVALMVGVYTAAFIGYEYNPWTAFLRLIDKFIIGVFINVDHIYVILFAWFLAGMVACIQKAGGATGLARSIASFAASRRLALICSWILGLLIFFDDYTNCLVVGNTMRPVTDAFLVSREKLAYIIDGTAAPITSIMPISSWIGFELTLIEDAFQEINDKVKIANIPNMYDTSPFLLFVKSIPGRYYPIAMIVLVIVGSTLNYDMGPMLWAERRALEEHKIVSDFAVLEETDDNDILEEDYDTPTRWWNSVLPVTTVTIGTVLGIILTGYDELDSCNSQIQECRSKSVEHIFGSGDPFRALLWSAAGGTLVIWTLSSIQHKTNQGTLKFGLLGFGFSRQSTVPIVGFFKSVHIWLEGMKSLMGATMVLILAWALSNAIRFVGTDRFIASGLGDNLDQRALPVVTFLISATMGFATGTSWGTMTIMFPIVTKAAFEADPTNEELMINCISSVLSGAVWGDHCTFISDTTILSSLSARCDVRHHVITQLPYSMLVGIVSTLVGELCVGYGKYKNYVGLIVTCITVVVLFLIMGAPVNGRRYDLLTFIVGGIIFWRPCQTCKEGSEQTEDDEEFAAAHNGDGDGSNKRMMVQRIMMDGNYGGNPTQRRSGGHNSQLQQRPSLTT